MKLVDQGQKVAASGEEVAQAVLVAGETITAELTALPKKMLLATAAMQEAFVKLVNTLADIPGLLNPSEIVGDFAKIVQDASSSLQSLATDASDIPGALLEQAKTFRQVAADVQQAMVGVTDLPEQLILCVPDFNPRLEDIKAALKTLLSSSQRLPLLIQAFDQYSQQAVPEVQQLRTQVSNLAVHPADTLKQSTQEQLQRMQQSLNDMQSVAVTHIKGVQSDVFQAADSVKLTAKSSLNECQLAAQNALSKVQERIQSFLKPIYTSEQLLRDFSQKIDDETTHCNDLLDQARESLEHVLAGVLDALAAAQSRLDDVMDKVHAAADDVKDLVVQALDPLDSLQNSAQACAQAISDGMSSVNKAVSELNTLIGDLNDQANNTKDTLRDLPDEFDIVKEQIAEGIGLISDIKSSVPGFVSSATAALSTASDELAQASDKCDDAIAICTQYMMKVPPLIAARLLFVGVKSSLPAIQTSIQAAKSTVKSAGDTANTLLGQAISTVQALNPVLDKVIEQVSKAIDEVIKVIEQLQMNLAQAQTKMQDLIAELQQTVDAIPPKIETLIDGVKATAQTYLDDIKPQEVADEVQLQLEAIKLSVFSPIEKKVASASSPLAASVAALQAQVADASQTLQGHCNAMANELATVPDHVDASSEKLQGLFNSIETQMNELCDQACEQADRIEDQMKVGIDHLTNQFQQFVEKAGLQIQNSMNVLSQTQLGNATLSERFKALPQQLDDLEASYTSARAQLNGLVDQLNQGLNAVGVEPPQALVSLEGLLSAS